MSEFRPGLYRHYKQGNLYTALCLVTHHETRLPMVLYVSHVYGGFNVRPLYGWEAEDQSACGASQCDDRDGWLDDVVAKCSCADALNFGEPAPDCTPCGGRGTVIVPRFAFVGDLPSDVPIGKR